MEKTIDEASWKEISYFDNIVGPIIKLLENSWNIEASPKGYDEYVKTYEEFDDVNDEKFDLEFEGLLNTSASGSPINLNLALPNVAYNDTQKSRDTLNTLVSSILSYGIAIGRQQEKTHPDREYQTECIQRGINCLLNGKNFEDMKTRAEMLSYNFNSFNKNLTNK